MPERVLIDHCSPTLAGLKTGNTEAMANAVADGAKDKGRKCLLSTLQVFLPTR